MIDTVCAEIIFGISKFRQIYIWFSTLNASSVKKREIEINGDSKASSHNS